MRIPTKNLLSPDNTWLIRWFFFSRIKKPPIVSYFTKYQCFACIIPEAKIVILCIPSNAQTAKEKCLCLFPFMFGKSIECTTFKSVLEYAKNAHTKKERTK